MDVAEEKITFKVFLDKYKSIFFTKRIYPSENFISILKHTYPTIPWSRVKFFHGIPWYTKMINPSITAQALPDLFTPGNFNIFLKVYDEKSCDCLSITVHEGYHILQYLSFLNGYGLGFLRGFIVYYNAYYMHHGYMNNPFEVPAYKQEHDFYRLCKSHNLLTNSKSAELITAGKVQINEIYFKYSGNVFFLVISFLFNLVIMIAAPVAEILLRINYYCLKGINFLFESSKKILPQ